ncbi:MAG: cyclic nucleotide-binding domain-containing protein, partial [Gammaproteobacteria bacterium]
MDIPEDKQKYAEVIRQLIPINELPPEIQNQLITNAVLVEVAKQQLVFNQGDRDGYSFYLLEGSIELEASGQVHNTISAGSDRACYPLAQLQPRQFTGKAKTASVVFRISRDTLDKLLVMHHTSNDSDDGLSDTSGAVELDVIDGVDDEGDWMTRMLQSEIFAGMPTSNIHKLFSLLEPVEYKTGDVVIKQGEPGNHYYIIQEGRCEVLRQSQPGGKQTRLAELLPGDSFGEEALIIETVRNATVRMATDGVVAQLSKEDFVTLIQKSTLKSVTSGRAQEIVAGGGKWLDVRFKNEHDRSTIDDCEHIPLNILRMQADKLDKNIHYVLFCDTGGRSSVGAFLLTDRGFTVSYLEGGLVNHPELAPPEDVTAVPKPAAPPPAKKATTPASPAKPAKPETPAAKSKPVPPPSAEPVAEPDAEMDPEIMASVLEAELEHTNMRIKRAKEQDQTEQKNIKLAKQLEQERVRIEESKKRVQAEVLKLRKQEETRLKQMEAESAKRLQAEREKIESVYSRNAEEIEKLEKMKLEAEEKMHLERERIEKEAEAARKSKQDAEKIKQELEAAHKKMEEVTRKNRLEQEALRKKIEQQARQKIEEERKHLAEQLARTNQEVEQARREKAIAEAARAAAKQEAELMIKEYKSQHDKSRAEEEARIKAERLKLEAEQKKIQKVLQEVQRTKAEAEALKRAALAEVTALKAKQYQEEVTRSEQAKSELKTKIKNAQDKLSKAQETAARAEQDEEKAVVAKKVNEEDLVKKKAEEEALAKQLQADLAEFKE